MTLLTKDFFIGKKWLRISISNNCHLFDPSRFTDPLVFIFAFIFLIGLWDFFVVVIALIPVEGLTVVAVLRLAVVLGVGRAIRTVLCYTNWPEKDWRNLGRFRDHS